MRSSRVLEQSVAVFGESGSGKSVLVSSFFGATQEPSYRRQSLFDVVPDDIGQGNRLLKNYLGMRDGNVAPVATRFAATSYAFTVRLKNEADAAARRSRPFDALRIVWHDYPGEWFEQSASGPEEERRRLETFRSLMGSDVAIVLVDGQRLLDSRGEEERYLKSLFGNLRNGLLSLKDGLLEHGPLVDFPRIWVLALSKADLLPHLDVYGFRDLLVTKASEEIDDLRESIGGLLLGSDALSVGEDFMLLSSAKFDAGRIDVDDRIGVELLLPLAAMLPLERHVRWAKARQLPAKVVENLIGAGALGAGALSAAMLGTRLRLPGPFGLVQTAVGAILSREVLDDAAKLAGAKLREVNARAVATHNGLTAMLTGFRLDLERGEAEQTLLRSRR